MNQFLKSNRNRRVLVADDEVINRELLEAILSLNYDVDTASNGEEAMEMLRAAKEPYSLLLLDLLMPKMSGFEVLEAVKSDDKLREIPIIVMTSEKSAEVRSIKLGAEDFITKPYRMPEVILARCERIVELSEEKQLIRSIERDEVTKFYIKVFFYAYIRRLLSSVDSDMDALSVSIDGFTDEEKLTAEERAQLEKVAELIDSTLVNAKGIACRLEDNTILVYLRHNENYGEPLGRINDALRPMDIRIKAGVCEKVDRTLPPESWFEKAKTACESGAGTVAFG